MKAVNFFWKFHGRLHEKVIFEPVLEGWIGICPKEEICIKFYSQKAVGHLSNRKWNSEVRKSNNASSFLPIAFGLEVFWFGKLVIILVSIIQFSSHGKTEENFRYSI